MGNASFVVAAALIPIVLVLLLLWRSIHVVRPYQRGVVTRLGAYRGTLDPGFHLVSVLSRVQLVDVRDQRLQWGPEPFVLPTGTRQVRVTITYRVVDSPKAAAQGRRVTVGLTDAVRASLSMHLGVLGTEAESPSDYDLTLALRSDLTAVAERYGLRFGSVVVQQGLSPRGG